MSFHKIMQYPESFTQRLLKDDLHNELKDLFHMTPYKCLQKGFFKKKTKYLTEKIQINFNLNLNSQTQSDNYQEEEFDTTIVLP